MTAAAPHPRVTPNTAVRLGWILVALVSAFLLMTGLFVLTTPVDRDYFASTTGMTWPEFEAQSPSVAPNVERTGRLLGVGSSAFGLLALVIAVTRLRVGDPWAARTLWILPLGLGAYTLLFVLDGVTTLAAFYAALASAAAGGLLLATRGLAAAQARGLSAGPTTEPPEG
ncbi:hypothetical protein BH23CHL8_BH23CHL8_21340 [soil metagenome]